MGERRKSQSLCNYKSLINSRMEWAMHREWCRSCLPAVLHLCYPGPFPFCAYPTRAGKGTKIILLGDPQQIDHPLLDERTNGLSYASEKMKGSPLCWQVTMSAEECERSALAMDAVQRM